MKKSFLLFFSIFAQGILIFPNANIADAQIDRAQLVQADIEKSIKLIIGSQLAETEYFVYAKVKLEERANAAATGEDRFLNLPYSPIKVEKDYLEALQSHLDKLKAVRSQLTAIGVGINLLKNN